MATHSQMSIDCEGPCCCRCHTCKGVGYYQSYTVTIPQPTSIVNPSNPFDNCGTIHTGWWRCLPLTTGVTLFPPGTATLGCFWGYGSEGSVGCCEWVLPRAFFGCTFGVILYNYNLQLVMNHETLTMTVWFNQLSGGFFTEKMNVYTFRNSNPDCRLGGTFVFESAVEESDCKFDWTGAPIIVEPFEGATWYSCGQNEDGSPVTDPEVGVERLSPLFRAMMPGVRVSTARGKIALPTIARPQRCDSLAKRTEFKGGCNGFLCAHGCEKNLPAVPGAFCQTCPSYKPDPDYPVRNGGQTWT